jgi:epoxyqueuosine reductase
VRRYGRFRGLIREPKRHHIVQRARQVIGRDVLGVWVRPKVFECLRFVPSLPSRRTRRYDGPRKPWPAFVRQIPEQLKTVPGPWIDDDAANAAYSSQGPVREFHGVIGQAAMFWEMRSMWRSLLPTRPRDLRARRALEQASVKVPLTRRDESQSPAYLAAGLKAEAASLGFSACGITPLDPRYELVEFAEDVVGDRVIVLISEQNWPLTQTIPSVRAERAALNTYSDGMERGAVLARYLTSRGFKAVISPPDGARLAIPYAVAAGLGQLGLNGQLLTPQAGSRCRIQTINTDAPLDTDLPVDYGIHAICDLCKACVRRCPARAIPGKRLWHRGVYKAKIKTDRCLPTLARTEGCAVCMKVCPVQRYGLTAVLDELERSGRILGRGTDELEGYRWPLDGKHYGPRELPPRPDTSLPVPVTYPK